MKEDLADKIVNHFLHQGAEVKKSDYNFVLTILEDFEKECEENKG